MNFSKGTRKIVLVIGGASGIGGEISTSLLKEGYDLIIHFNSSKNDAERISSIAKKMKRRVLLIQGDLELEVDRDMLSDYVKKSVKSLYSIVFSSGINEKKSYKDIDDETINRIFDVNVKSPLIIIKQLLPLLKKNTPNSSILFIGSLYSYIGGSEESLLYSTSKSALTGLSRTIAKISTVRSNIIIPGYIDAPSLYSKRMVSDIEKKEKIIPQGRLGATREVADLACFMLSEKATYITGQEIHINGGIYFG